MKMLLVAAVLAATPALAQQARFYDSRGNSLGTASTSPSGQTRYYDSRGNSLGTSSTSGKTTTFYNSRGTVTGRASR
jgi:YD repeat-containing protein